MGGGGAGERVKRASLQANFSYVTSEGKMR